MVLEKKKHGRLFRHVSTYAVFLFTNPYVNEFQTAIDVL